MTPIRAKYSPLKLLGLAAAAIMLFVLGINVPYNGGFKNFMGSWGCMAIGAGLMFIVIKRFMDKDLQLEIDERGIYWKNLKQGIIPWSEIEGISSSSVKSQKFLNLRLKNPNIIRKRHWGNKYNRMLGFGDVSVVLQSLDCNFDEVYSTAKHYLETSQRVPTPAKDDIFKNLEF